MIIESKKKQIISMHENGFSYQKISKQLKIPKSTIQCIITPTYKKTCVRRGPKSKITSKISKCIKESMKRIYKRNEIVTASKIQKCSRFNASISTIQRHLRSQGLKYRNLQPKIVLNENHKTMRKTIVKQWLQERIDPKVIIFTDEKIFRVDGPDNMYSWLSKDTSLKKDLRVGKGGSIPIYGYLTPDCKFEIKFLQENMTGRYYVQILKDVLPKLNAENPNYIFMQDGAPAHRSKITQQYINDIGIKLLKWPARSPDLNIIEDMWAYMTNKIYSGPKVKDKADLKLKILLVQNYINLTQKEMITRLYNSFLGRCIKCIESNGDIVK